MAGDASGGAEPPGIVLVTTSFAEAGEAGAAGLGAECAANVIRNAGEPVLVMLTK
jgi:hypothetical protein